MKLAAFSAVILSVLAAAVRSPSASEDVPRLYYAGLYQEIGLGDIDQAIESYRLAAEGDKGETAGKAVLRLGLCCEKTGNRLEARDAFNRALADFSVYPEIVETASEALSRLYADGAPEKGQLAALISRGLAAAGRGDLSEAKGIFKQACSLEPKNTSLQKQIADLSQRLGQPEEAIYYYQRVVPSPEYVSDFPVHRALADCYRAEARWEEAIRLWGDFLESNKGNPLGRERALFELDLVYEQADASAGEETPADLEASLARGEEETRAADYRAASETYRAAGKRFGGSYLPPRRLAFLQERFLDQPTVAVWYYKEALNKAPPLAAQRLRCRLARLLARRGSSEEAARYLDQFFSHGVRPLEADPVMRDFLAGRKEWKSREE